MMLRSPSGDTFETEEVDLKFMLDLAPGNFIWDPFVAPGSFSQRFISEHCSGPSVNDIVYDTATREQVQSRVDCIVTNPPFSKKEPVLQRLVVDWEVPFVIILPTSALQRKFMRRFLAIGEWEIYIPNRFLRFHVAGRPCPSPPFPSAFFAWQPSDINSVKIRYIDHPDQR
jgi:hypothetical protein